MSTVSYLAFRASDELRDDTELLIKKSKSGSRESLIDQMNIVMSSFVEEMLDRFFLDTCEAVELSPMASKVVRGGANTLGTTANLLIKQVFKKRTNDELYPLIQHLDSTFIRATDSSSKLASVACELEGSLSERLMKDLDAVRNGDLQGQTESLTQLMLEVTDAAFLGYAEVPMNMLKMNVIAKKVSYTGIETCRSAVKMVINKVFKKLENEQLVQLADYFDSLLITAPKQ